MSKYSQQQIEELAEQIVSKIHDVSSIATATEELTSEGAPSVSLGTVSAVTAISSLIADMFGSQATSATMAQAGRQLAGINVLYELLDFEFDWHDVAALSTAVGANLLTNPSADPMTKAWGGLFLFYGETIPFWNWIGHTYGFNLLRNLDPLGLYDDINTNFLQSKNWSPPRTDPLAIDLDNDGIETIGINGSVIFDHDGDGIKTGTGWVVSDDGFLVLDHNNNGTIDTGAELFGVDTVKADGTLATDGFDALADLDSNANGLFDKNDTKFAQVQIWRDLNQNGISTANELFFLDELGVVNIDLNASSQNVNFGNGNVQTASAAHLTLDGEGKTGNLDLANNPFYREFIDKITLTEAALKLSDTKGAGLVRDLREAASLSPAVTSILSAYTNKTSYTDQKAQLDDLLTAWAKTSTMKTSVEQAADHGYYLFYLPPDHSWSDYDEHLSYWNSTDSSNWDALSSETREAYETLQQQQHELVGIISVLERFNASTFVEVGKDRVILGNGFQNLVNSAPGNNETNAKRVFVSLSTAQTELLQQSYETLKESVYGSLVLQTRLSQYLNEINLNVNESAEVFVDFSELNALLDHHLTEHPTIALSDLIELNKYAGNVLHDYGWNGLDMLRSWIDAGVGGEQTESILRDLGVNIIRRDISSGVNDDIIFSQINNTSLSGFIGDDILNGSVGNDTLLGGSGNDLLEGGGGRDLLIGGGGNDVLRGGTGENDHLRGDSGNDIYLFAAGDGNTLINNNDTDASQDVLRFMKGINPGDVIAKRDSHSLYLSVQTTGEVITVTNYFYENSNTKYELDTIEFNDGSVWDAATIKQMVLQPTVGSDNIIGFKTEDVIFGLSGDDILSGAGGNDILSGGDGSDSIIGGEGNDTINGGAGKDNLHGNHGDDILNGGDGIDMLFGGAGDDLIRGGLGSDHMRGDSGNDTYLIAAGDGNTSINNNDTGDSQDVLRFMEGINPGDVVVTRNSHNLFLTLQNTGEIITVTNYFYQDGDSDYLLDMIEFNDGTIWDVATVKQMSKQGTAGDDSITGSAFDDIIDGQDGNDTLSGVDGDDTLNGGAGSDILLGNHGNDNLNGGDGTDMLFGGAGDDTLRGGLGVNDHMRGDVGNDTYLFAPGDGNSSINNYDTNIGRQDVLRFLEGMNPNDVMVLRFGNDLRLKLSSTSEVITVSNYFFNDGDNANILNVIEFSDGTSWDVATVKQMMLQGTSDNDNITGLTIDDVIDELGGDDVISGASGNDTLNGGAGNDSLTGGNGDDTLMGDAGNDIYLFIPGDGNTIISNYDTGASSQDVLRFGASIDVNDVVASRFSNSLKLTIASTNEVITVSNYFLSDGASAYVLDSIEFNDSTRWDVATVKQMVQQGSVGNDTLFGYSTNDIINGLEGNDSLSGADGDDILNGGSGNDLLWGNNGDDLLKGGDGRDTLFGGAGDDTLRGGLGNNDTLFGEAGNDIYLFFSGDGNTTISNYDVSAGRQDVLRFETGIEPEDVVVSRFGNSLKLTLQSTNEVVTIQNHFINSGYMLNAVEFSNSTSWDSAALSLMVLNGTEGNDHINGFASDDTINGLGGNDILYGSDGNDSLAGGEGNDIVYGQTGDDFVFGDGGDDYVYGNSGNDTLNGGNGLDILHGDAGNDTVIGGAGGDTMTGGVGLDTFIYNSSDSIAPVIENSVFADSDLSVADKISFANGVDIIKDFLGGEGGDLFDGANPGMPTTGIGISLSNGFSDGVTYFISGTWMGNSFTVATDGAGADTMIIEGSGVAQESNKDHVILVGVNSDDLIAANFI